MKKAATMGIVVLLALTFIAMAPLALAEEKAAPTVDMTGKWKMDARTSLGNGSPTISLKQKDNKLSGTYYGVMGGREQVTGEVDGDRFKLKFHTQGVTITYKGVVNGDEVKGSIAMPPFGNGTFKGKRL